MNNLKSYKIIVHSKKMRNIFGASPAEVAKKVALKLLVKNIYSMYFSIIDIKTNKIIHYQSNKKELARPYHKKGKLVKYRIIVKKMGKQVGGTYPPNLEDENDPIFTFFPKEKYNIKIYYNSITIINKSNNEICIEIHIHIHGKENKKIFIENLNHCGYNGRTNLEAIIEYSKELNKESKIIESLYLIDASYLKHSEISLSTLYILTTGKSWYNQFGFFSEIYQNEIENNKKFLMMTLEEFLNECIEKIQIDIKRKYNQNINKLQQQKEEFIRIFGNKNIRELFTEIIRMLREIKLSEKEIKKLEKILPELKDIIELIEFIRESKIIMYSEDYLYLML